MASFMMSANYGKLDHILTASKLLARRCAEITAIRTARGFSNVNPTLADIEKTHVLFVNGNFKPYAQIAFEYVKVPPHSSVNLGTSCTFSIPQFGDFWHDIIIHTRLGAVAAATPQSCPLRGSTAYPENIAIGTGVTVAETYSCVDAFGVVYPDAVAASTGVTAVAQPMFRNLVRYAEYPANMLFSKVAFTVNGNNLDDYDESLNVMFQKFCVAPNKEVGYDKCVGQEIPMTGYTGPQYHPLTDGETTPNTTFYNLHNTPSHPSGVSMTNPDQSVTTTYNHIGRYKFETVDGPQTPKPSQPALDLYYKLHFWFGQAVQDAVPSVAIPHGQRFISVTLAHSISMVYEFCNCYIKRMSDDGSSRTVTYTPYNAACTIPEINVEDMKMYINNIFVNTEIHDIYIARIGFSLIRVHRIHKQRISQNDQENKQLTSLKWPVEYLYVGMRPSWNIATANPEKYRDWHMMSRIYTAVAADTTLVESATGDTTVEPFSMEQIVKNSYGYEAVTCDSMTVTAHGIKLYDGLDTKFYNAYMPYHYGGSLLSTPKDSGVMFINFALYPGSYQPSGHLNLSRAREFFLDWRTSYVSGHNTADLIAIAICLNFLLLSDGSATLRYST
jgi:hypothetical protein